MHLRRERIRLTLALGVSGLVGASLAGCGPGGDGMGPDADVGVTADAGFSILPPNIDWLEAGVPPIAPPSLTPCPEGWREALAEEGGPATCAPYPEGGAKECADGWAHFLGEPDCTPVGAPCPVGDFPEGLPTDQPVLYVLAGASASGDGSEGTPFASIAEAMALASPGTVIALGKGIYDEAVDLATGVTLWGACAAETRLTVSSPTLTVRSVVQVGGADTRLQSVRIGPADIPGLLVIGPRADVTAEGVLIDLAVRDTEGHESYGLFGRGLDVESGATTSVTRALFERNRDVGVYASGVGTSVTLTDVVARDTQSQESDGAAGHGLNVQTGAAANVTRALFEGNRNIGVFVLNAGTSVTLTDVVVRDTQSQRSDRGGARPRHPGERDGGGHSRAL